MKKALLALAVLGAAAGAQAANVDVYGIIDYGFKYTNVNPVEGETTSTFGLDSGVSSASRLGLKGSEDLGNGMTVAFKLENGFKGDDGTMSQGADKLFGREASLSLTGAAGTISFGRMGGLTAAAGTYDVFMAAADPFDGGKQSAKNGFYTSDRYDNMVTYATPEFGGAKIYAQYSFQTEGAENADEGQNNRYASLGASYNVGNLTLVAAVENYRYAGDAIDNGTTFNFGGNYDCGFAKTFFAVQLAKNVDNFAYGDKFEKKADGKTFYKVNELVDVDGVDSTSLMLGTQFKIAAGTTTLAAYWADREGRTRDRAPIIANDFDAEYLGFGARYEYPLSQRTSLYTGATWAKTEAEVESAKAEYNQYDLFAGIKHTF